MSGDDLTRFCEAIADVLEVETIGPDDEFRAVPDWCSLKAFGILVTLENDWKAPLTVARFQELKTVGDLWNEVCSRRASVSDAHLRVRTRAERETGETP